MILLPTLISSEFILGYDIHRNYATLQFLYHENTLSLHFYFYHNREEKRIIFSLFTLNQSCRPLLLLCNQPLSFSLPVIHALSKSFTLVDLFVWIDRRMYSTRRKNTCYESSVDTDSMNMKYSPLKPCVTDNTSTYLS
jgi:hypothetical protein